MLRRRRTGDAPEEVRISRFDQLIEFIRNEGQAAFSNVLRKTLLVAPERIARRTRPLTLAPGTQNLEPEMNLFLIVASLSSFGRIRRPCRFRRQCSVRAINSAAAI